MTPTSTTVVSGPGRSRSRKRRSLRSRLRSETREATRRSIRGRVTPALAGSGGVVTIGGVIAATLRPRGPYSLRLSARLGSDATRVVSDGTYRAPIAVDERLERVDAWQRVDGSIRVRADTEAGVEHVRFALGLEDDHSEFLRRFARDPLIGEATRRFRGLRPLRTGTVAQALLRAVAGQLILGRAARASIERARDPRRDAERSTASTRSPTTADLARFSPAAARAARARRAPRRRRSSASAARSTSSRCKGHPDRRRRAPARARARARPVVDRRRLPPGPRPLRARARARPRAREARCRRCCGRCVEAEETDELLAPYGEWAGPRERVPPGGLSTPDS